MEPRKFAKPPVNEGVIYTSRIWSVFEEMMQDFEALWGPNTKIGSPHADKITILALMDRYKHKIVDSRIAEELYKLRKGALEKAEKQREESHQTFRISPKERIEQRQRLKSD